MSLADLLHVKPDDNEEALEREVAKGYSIVFVGLSQAISASEHGFDDQIERLASVFDGPIAIVLNGELSAINLNKPLNLLVPASGTADARLATEIAVALAKAGGGRITALHVFDPQDETEFLRGRVRRQGLSVLVDARRIGKRHGVPVTGTTTSHARPEKAIERAARSSGYDLVVIGTSLRRGGTNFLGPRSALLVRALRMPVLLITR